MDNVPQWNIWTHLFGFCYFVYMLWHAPSAGTLVCPAPHFPSYCAAGRSPLRLCVLGERAENFTFVDRLVVYGMLVACALCMLSRYRCMWALGVHVQVPPRTHTPLTFRRLLPARCSTPSIVCQRNGMLGCTDLICSVSWGCFLQASPTACFTASTAMLGRLVSQLCCVSDFERTRVHTFGFDVSTSPSH